MARAEDMLAIVPKARVRRWGLSATIAHMRTAKLVTASALVLVLAASPAFGWNALVRLLHFWER
ncbi:MAG: hypothetical protein CMJ58_01910 [Planctomycetaceae bacterium]|nr:hypothetical protein [Planctomycetaceae bacterium]